MCADSVISLTELATNPHPILADLRRTQPVCWVEPLGAYVITSRVLAMAVLRDEATFTVDDDRFTTARIIGRSMLSTDAAAYARHRAPFARAYRLEAVRARHAAAVGREVTRLLESIDAAAPVDLREAFTAPLAAATMVDALSLDATVGDVLAIYDAIVGAVAGLSGGDDPPLAAAAAMDDLRRIVARSSGLGSEHASDVAVLLFGGVETTDGMLANALLHLLETPLAADAARADGAVLRDAIEESLRLEPAAATVDRYATRDTELGGVTIPARSLVTVSIAAANRDPATFADPDRFDVRRPNARLHLAFAQGPHVCLGMHLARLEAHVAIGAVLDRFPRMVLDATRPSAPRGLVFRKPPTLWACP